eukprot:SAG31_NODE_18350_length_639_cov_1.155556_1_plen_50_part_01
MKSQMMIRSVEIVLINFIYPRTSSALVQFSAGARAAQPTGSRSKPSASDT